MRRSTFLWSILAMSVVVGLFIVKHRVQTLEDRLQALNAEIITDRDAIQVMQAEWSYLNQPARLEALSKRWLGMDVPVSGQTVSMQELLEKSATAPSDTDDIAEIAATKKPTVKPAIKPAPARKAVPVKAPTAPGVGDWLKPILAKLKKNQ